MDPSRVVLSLTGVTKTFPGVVALRDVTFSVLAGEIHALVGGNGAGKSTLMGVAAGSILPDMGSIEIGGAPMTNPTPLSAARLGLSIVRQDPALLPDLSVAENMWLGVRPNLKGGIGAAGAWAAQRLAPWEVPIDPRARIADLSMHRRFIIEIAKALAAEPQVLVLDEPTEHLTAPEIEQLFVFVRAVKQRGGAVVYISHRIPEVLRIADRVTVLRDGQTRGTFERADVDESDVVKLIVGRAVEKVFPPKRTPLVGEAGSEPLLVVDALSGDGFSGISLTVEAGEVVGLAGVEGNGQRDFLRALAGMGPSKGSIMLGERTVRSNDPIASRAAGIGYLPQDRQTEALLLELSVRENMALSSLRRFANLGFVQRGAERTAVGGQIEALGIRSPSSETLIRALSGGNQQKVMLARQALAEPRVLLAEEPTQGVDAGARVEIYRILRSRADQGAGVVVVSTDEIELEGLCDRVLIFSRGHVVKELVGEQVTEHNIQAAALTATQLRERQDIAEERGTSRRARFRGFMRGDYGPALVLALVLLALGAVVTAVNPYYLTERNFASVFQLLTALALVSVAQLVVMLSGGIDLSVGPLAGFLVVVGSFFIVDKPDKIFGITGPTGVIVGVIAITVAALAVGLFNGFMVRKAHIPAVVVTLATFIGLQGLSQFFRVTTSGQIQRSVTDLLKLKVSFLPVVLVLTVALVLLLEYALRRRRWGLELRAVGSSERAAQRLGIRVDRTVIGAYVLCSLIVIFGAFLLMAQIGVGDPLTGVSYTLSSITAVVLGGASIYGGRGSFIATLLGAAILQQINTVTSFLKLDSSATYLLLGLLTLIAAAIYSVARETKARA